MRLPQVPSAAQVPTEQLAPVHIEPVGATHAVRLVPLQRRAQGPEPPHAVRLAGAAPVTGEHVPAVPARLQASHWPVHAALQHTPSAQMPERQSVPLVHVAPLASSRRHVAPHPSPVVRLPSSHSSPGSTTMSPQLGTRQLRI